MITDLSQCSTFPLFCLLAVMQSSCQSTTLYFTLLYSTQCVALWCTAMHCDALQYTTIHCNALSDKLHCTALQGFLGVEVQDARLQSHCQGQGCEAAAVTVTSRLGNNCLAEAEGVPGKRNSAFPFAILWLLEGTAGPLLVPVDGLWPRLFFCPFVKKKGLFMQWLPF